MVLSGTIVSSKGHYPHHILLADEDDGDAFLIKEAIGKLQPSCGISVEVHYVQTGKACLDFLRRKDRYHAAPKPHLIMLELDRTAMTSLDVLEEVVADSELKCLPVVVLTLSPEPRFLERLYQLRCNGIITKPADAHEFQRRVQVTCNYWLSVATLPTEPWRVPTAW